MYTHTHTHTHTASVQHITSKGKPLAIIPTCAHIFVYTHTHTHTHSQCVIGKEKLTKDIPNKEWPPRFWQINTQEGDGDPREGDSNANEGIDGVTEEGHNDQKQGAYAEHDGKKQAQLK